MVEHGHDRLAHDRRARCRLSSVFVRLANANGGSGEVTAPGGTSGVTEKWSGEHSVQVDQQFSALL